MRIAILGFGREGKSVLKFLKRAEKFRQAKIDILDQKTDKNYLKKLALFDIVFRSPGVPLNLPEIKSAINNGVAFSSATKLFFELCPAKIIGVTGTKGKSTTSTLIYRLLKNAGFDAHLAGNIGTPSLDILPKIESGSWIVLELSSFQLQDLNISPRIAVIVDTFPDHLDIHKNANEYLEAKANIVRYQHSSDKVFHFQDNHWSVKISNKSPGEKISIYGEPFGLRKNVVMAAVVASEIGCPSEIITKTIKNFTGLEHRLELVQKIRSIYFYNDSASTNPHTTAKAISSFGKFPSSVMLIAGGRDKNLDYKPLADAVRKSGNVSEVILFGENKIKIRESLDNAKSNITNYKSLYSAVASAYKKAKTLSEKLSESSIIILFSPGSASFDMFKDYQDRGKQFKLIVNKLSKI